MGYDKRLKTIILDLMGRLAVRSGQLLSPAVPVDIFYTNGALVIKAEVAGVSKKYISLSHINNVILIEYIRILENKNSRIYYKMERGYGKFKESIELPLDIGLSNVKAKLNDGILTITITGTSINSEHSD